MSRYLAAVSPMQLYAFVLPVVILSGSTCHGWGTTGHEIVANVAWSQLSTETRAWVAQVLNTTSHDGNYVHDDGDEDPGSPLGAVADWADQVRHFFPWSAPLHYIDVRDDEFSDGCHVAPHLNPSCHFDYDRDCPNNSCVAGAIVNYTHQLLHGTKLQTQHPLLHNKKQPQQQKGYLRGSLRPTDPTPLLKQDRSDISKTKEALMFLTHFVGDIHQPLHCSRTTDKGGNDFHVHFDPKISDAKAAKATISDSIHASHHPHGWNLHSVWDTGLIDVALERDYNNSRQLLEQALLQELNNRTAASLTKSTTRNRRAKDYLECDKALGANQTCTIQWGQESWDMAIRFAYTLDDNTTDVTNGATLDEQYFLTRWPLAKERLLAGAVRLAGTLEWIAKTNTNNENKIIVANDNDDDPHGTFLLKVPMRSPNQRLYWWVTSFFAW